MNKKILLSLCIVVSLSAQTLKTTVGEVLSTNPTVLERQKNYNATKQDIQIAKAGFYPKIDLSLGVGIENTNKSELTTTPSSQSYNFSVYENSITYTHNLFNGFATTYQVQQQKNRAIAAAYSYIENINDIAFQTTNSYIDVLKNHELVEIEKENVEINLEILQKVQKLYDAGLTTLSEVNKIESSLALAKSNLVVQENTYLDYAYHLHKIVGRDLDPTKMSTPVLNIELPKTMEEATLFAMQNNPSILVSNYNIKLAQAAYKEKKAPFYPSIDIEVSQSFNKNLSAVEGKNNRFKAMAYLTYNLFNGYADSVALQKTISTIHQEIQIKNKLIRETMEGLKLSWAAYTKLTEQLKHLKNYKKFSLKTLELYSKEYDLGRRSLLDLLSAQNDFIGSKSQIVNTEYNILFAKYRILDAMGTLVEAISGKTDIYYSNVNLAGKKNTKLDTLPVKLDSDNDLIVDSQDICSNSLSDTLKNRYGCKSNDKTIKQIQRYSPFLFEAKSSKLTKEGQNKLSKLIKQISSYDIKTLKFDLLGNVNEDEQKEEDYFLLSQQRAQKVQEELVKAGALKQNIKIYANSDKAPMFTNEKQKYAALNNRVDIIIKLPKK